VPILLLKRLKHWQSDMHSMIDQIKLLWGLDFAFIVYVKLSGFCVNQCLCMVEVSDPTFKLIMAAVNAYVKLILL
jgi:hypothetical protein